MSIEAKRADAVADLAAKEAEYSMMQEIEGRKCELEKLKVEKDLKAARARHGSISHPMSYQHHNNTQTSKIGYILFCSSCIR